VKRTLLLHNFTGSDYYLGAFLLGAYQEILGDLHNLFGDTNAVHVRLSPSGEVILDSVIKGDTVREVLNYVQFSSDGLVQALRKDVETALREGRLTYEESGALVHFYEEGLHGYTYLEDVHER
jgi:arginine decarboxylase